jgi:uncharacterized membrane protein (DUF106 family)
VRESYKMDILSILSNVIAQDLTVLQQIPTSTLLVLLISMAIGLVTTLVNRLVMNMDEYKKFTIDSYHVRQELMAAMKTKNQRQIAKAQKQQQDMMKVQQKMTMNQMKTTLLFFVPFLLIWQVFTNFFTGVIAFAPFEIPMFGSQLTFSSWYIISSLSSGIIARRVLGLSFEIEPEVKSEK